MFTYNNLPVVGLFSDIFTDSLKNLQDFLFFSLWKIFRNVFGSNFLLLFVRIQHFISILYIWNFVAHIYTYTMFVSGIQKRALDARDLSYRWLWATKWTLGRESGSSARAANALKHWAISLPQNISCHVFMFLYFIPLFFCSASCKNLFCFIF